MVIYAHVGGTFGWMIATSTKHINGSCGVQRVNRTMAHAVSMVAIERHNRNLRHPQVKITNLQMFRSAQLLNSSCTNVTPTGFPATRTSQPTGLTYSRSQMHPMETTRFIFAPPLLVTRPIATPPAATIVYYIPLSVSHPGRTVQLESTSISVFSFHDQASATLSVTPGHSRTNADYGPPPMTCLLYTSPSPRDGLLSRMPSSA